jgi:hypothetical protein
MGSCHFQDIIIWKTATISRFIALACRVIVLYNGEGLLGPSSLLHSYNSFSHMCLREREQSTVFRLPDRCLKEFPST